jgi:hypothetical protein
VQCQWHNSLFRDCLKWRKPFRLIDCLDRDSGMRIGGARPHLSSHPDGLHQLLAGHAMAERGFRVSSDAIGALSDVGHCDSDQLLGLR